MAETLQDKLKMLNMFLFGAAGDEAVTNAGKDKWQTSENSVYKTLECLAGVTLSK